MLFIIPYMQMKQFVVLFQCLRKSWRHLGEDFIGNIRDNLAANIMLIHH